MNYKKQHNINDFTNIYLGYLDRFINEYDFMFEPEVIHGEDSFLPEDYNIHWLSDILVADDYSLLLPKSYLITNYVDNSYSDDDTGHNLVEDIDFDVLPIMSDDDKYKVDFHTIIKPWILEAMREDDHPAYNEYINLITNKN